MSGIIGTGGKSGIIGAGSREGWILLETVSGTDTGHSIGSASTVSSEYDDYMITASGVNLSVASWVRCQIYIAGSLQEANYKTFCYGNNTEGATGEVSSADAGHCYISQTGVNNNAYDTMNFKLYFQNPTNTAYYHQFSGSGSFISSLGYGTAITFSAFNTLTGSALTGFKIYPTSGNITGVFSLFGLSK